MDKKVAFKIKIYSARTGCVAERDYSSLRKVNAALSGIVMVMLASEDDFIVQVFDNVTGQTVKRFTQLDDWFKDAEVLR